MVLHIIYYIIIVAVVEDATGGALCSCRDNAQVSLVVTCDGTKQKKIGQGKKKSLFTLFADTALGCPHLKCDEEIQGLFLLVTYRSGLLLAWFFQLQFVLFVVHLRQLCFKVLDWEQIAGSCGHQSAAPFPPGIGSVHPELSTGKLKTPYSQVS